MCSRMVRAFFNVLARPHSLLEQDHESYIESVHAATERTAVSYR